MPRSDLPPSVSYPPFTSAGGLGQQILDLEIGADFTDSGMILSDLPLDGHVGVPPLVFHTPSLAKQGQGDNMQLRGSPELDPPRFPRV